MTNQPQWKYNVNDIIIKLTEIQYDVPAGVAAVIMSMAWLNKAQWHINVMAHQTIDCYWYEGWWSLMLFYSIWNILISIIDENEGIQLVWYSLDGILSILLLMTFIISVSWSDRWWCIILLNIYWWWSIGIEAKLCGSDYSTAQ